MAILYSPSTRRFYDSRFRYPSLPDDMIEVNAVDHARLIREINSNGKEILVVHGELTLVDKAPVSAPATWELVRAQRNRLLRECDHTQLMDRAETMRAEWAAYRQLLRDLPQNYANAADVIWPTPPA